MSAHRRIGGGERTSSASIVARRWVVAIKACNRRCAVDLRSSLDSRPHRANGPVRGSWAGNAGQTPGASYSDGGTPARSKNLLSAASTGHHVGIGSRAADTAAMAASIRCIDHNPER